jgi:hypothetical protein
MIVGNGWRAFRFSSSDASAAPNVSLQPARITFNPPFAGWREVAGESALPDGHLRAVVLQPGQARVFQVGARPRVP